MLSKRTLLLHLLLIHVPFAISQTCVWKDGTKATTYRPCTDGASSGSCCDEGDVCLKSGLCYGAAGVTYRGACVSTWGSESCPTYCDEAVPYWANVYPCSTGGKGSDYPSTFWCGNGTQKTCSQTEGTVFFSTPGAPVRIISSQVSSTTTPPSSAKSSESTAGSSSSTPSSNPTASNCPTPSTGALPEGNGEQDKNNNTSLTAVGAGVGVPLGVLALAFLALYLNERRLRKNMARAGVGNYEPSYAPINNLLSYIPWVPKHELSANPDPAHELNGNTNRRHELNGADRSHELSGGNTPYPS